MATFTPHQDAALKAVGDWLKAKPGRNGTPPVFRLFGFAGTGKTTLARHIADGVDGEVKFAAFTGKAALVMRNKGCDEASTIHSLIYRTRESGEEQPSFELWDDAPASKAKLIVIDECSMVDAELGRDLMSFDCPLLVLGDPAQLPPIQGAGFFTNSEPDAMLTEVHRQAQDDPIVRMSMDVREGRELDIGRYGESEVVSRKKNSIPIASWPPTRSWSAATTRGARTICGCVSARTSRTSSPLPATSWCACATTARRACSTAACGA
ncbi:ATP-dependent exoDNAse (exonuclease V) alpha subunit [Bradyrhizobium sp. LM3.4]